MCVWNTSSALLLLFGLSDLSNSFTTPLTSLPGSSVLGISQAGILEWVAISFSLFQLCHTVIFNVSLFSTIQSYTVNSLRLDPFHTVYHAKSRIVNYSGRVFSPNRIKPDIFTQQWWLNVNCLPGTLKDLNGGVGGGAVLKHLEHHQSSEEKKYGNEFSGRVVLHCQGWWMTRLQADQKRQTKGSSANMWGLIMEPMVPSAQHHTSQGMSQVMKYRYLQFPTGIVFILNYLPPDFLTVGTG